MMMFRKFTESVVFCRKVGGGQSLIMGTMRIEDGNEIEEGKLYLVNLFKNTVLLGESKEIKNFNSHTMQENLRREIWPRVINETSDKLDRFFFATIKPLKPIQDEFFFYAALETTLFESDSDDSWHEFDEVANSWSVKGDERHTQGDTVDMISRETAWRLGDREYRIEANPTKMRELQNFFRYFFVKLFESGLESSNYREVARDKALEAGYDAYLVDDILRSAISSYREKGFMTVLSKVYKVHPSGVKCVTEIEESIAREDSFKKAVKEVANSLQ